MDPLTIPDEATFAYAKFIRRRSGKRFLEESLNPGMRACKESNPARHILRIALDLSITVGFRVEIALRR
jgi:hypothetical protein